MCTVPEPGGRQLSIVSANSALGKYQWQRLEFGRSGGKKSYGACCWDKEHVLGCLLVLSNSHLGIPTCPCFPTHLHQTSGSLLLPRHVLTSAHGLRTYWLSRQARSVLYDMPGSSWGPTSQMAACVPRATVALNAGLNRAGAISFKSPFFSAAAPVAFQRCCWPAPPPPQPDLSECLCVHATRHGLRRA